MSSKELRKELIEFYESRGLSVKITSVPDGCYIYPSFEVSEHKFFVRTQDWTRNKDLSINYLQEVDIRLQV